MGAAELPTYYSSFMFHGGDQIQSPFYYNCDGSWEGKAKFRVNKPIQLKGIGFLGPSHADQDSYLVDLNLWGLIRGEWVLVQKQSKQVLAFRNQVFLVMLDHPVKIPPWRPDPLKSPELFNIAIGYRLHGPPTQCLDVKFDHDGEYKFARQHQGVRFDCSWTHQQLNEIVFRRLA